MNTYDHVGFTGTRRGMTVAQKVAVRRGLESVRPRIVHHGDCVGADAEFDAIAKSLGISTIMHPPSNDALRAFTTGHMIPLLPLPYIMRNQAIVGSSWVLFATPAESSWVPDTFRSGTWATIRYALSVKRQVVIFWPDGREEIR